MNDVEIQANLRLTAENEITSDIDSIWVYGNRSQSKLAEFSKTISRTAIQNNLQTFETSLENAIADIEALSPKDNVRISRGLARRKQYLSVLNRLDKITVQLRLQQAQLLKSRVIYERMYELIERCCQELEIYIEVGETKLGKSMENTRSPKADTDMNLWGQEDWDTRFQRKIDELRTCLVIASQSKVQAELMHNNCSSLAEKIGVSLRTTIPLWQNQIALMLGIEEYEDSLSTQAKRSKAVRSNIKNNKKTLKEKIKSLKRAQTNELDETEALRLNKDLAESLQNIALLNLQTGTMQKELQGAITRISSIPTAR